MMIYLSEDNKKAAKIPQLPPPPFRGDGSWSPLAASNRKCHYWVMYSHWAPGCARRRWMTVTTTRQSSLSVTRPVKGTSRNLTMLGEGPYKEIWMWTKLSIVYKLSGQVSRLFKCSLSVVSCIHKSVKELVCVVGKQGEGLVRALWDFAKSRCQVYQSQEFSSSRAAAHCTHCHNCTELSSYLINTGTTPGQLRN